MAGRPVGEHRLEKLLPERTVATLVSKEVAHMLLAECARQKDLPLTQLVEKLTRERDVTFSDQSYGLLVKAYSGDPSRLSALLEGLLARGSR